MQPCLNDGHEAIIIQFNGEEVEAYKQLFGDTSPSNQVPPLYCAKLWPQFELFQPFMKKAILLKETQVTQIYDLEVNSHYLAEIYTIEQKKVRQFMKYVLKLEINKNENKCITITQTFMERI
ncbi:hypothetical protein [Staphylococcus caeli]|uniref:hypothetical protein n=1 Tax=Staphylococcus caeli TaxID=2201815 RepID=UPI003F56CD3C